MRNGKRIKGKLILGVVMTILLSFFCLGVAFADKKITLTVAGCWAPDWPTHVGRKSN